MLQEQEIIADIKRVAVKLKKRTGYEFGRTEYLINGAQFSVYDIYDDGKTWSYYCESAGFKTRTIEAVPDEVYFERLRRATLDWVAF